MYSRILVAIEHSAADRTIVEHIAQLAALTGGQLHLVHVADGWAARNFDALKLRESEEMKEDRAYLESVAAELTARGLRVSAELAAGDPAREILRVARAWEADLIAMSTHGHRFLNDLIRGTTVDEVRHSATIPVLLLKARPA